MNKLIFPDTHVYPGCPVTILGKITHKGSVGSAIAAFSDGAESTAEIEPLNSEELIVRIAPYTTTRGTQIAEKTWQFQHNKITDTWKVISKV